MPQHSSPPEPGLGTLELRSDLPSPALAGFAKAGALLRRAGRDSGLEIFGFSPPAFRLPPSVSRSISSAAATTKAMKLSRGHQASIVETSAAPVPSLGAIVR